MAEEKDKGIVDRSKKRRKDIRGSIKKESAKEAAMMAGLKRSAKPVRQKLLGTHKVVPGDSMSAIALKFYGSGVKKNWMAIYEANKELIGDDPTLIHPGYRLKIPELLD